MSTTQQQKQQRLFVLIVATTTVLLSRTPIVKSLPVTSKPIENTPENLAWEAWLMLPPSTNERTRKITPKSIFILNGSQDGLNSNGNSNLFGSGLPQPQQQIQCPPNHRVDNFKCIPTLSIDRDEIMIKEFAQLLGNINKNPSNGNNNQAPGSSNNQPNYSYEFEEYDYGDYNTGSIIDEDIQFSPSSNNNNNNNNNKPDSEQPLKINLALDKFPLPPLIVENNNNNKPNADDDDNIQSVEVIKEDHTGIGGQPFRGEVTSSTTITVPTTTTQQNGKRSTNTTDSDRNISTTSSSTSTSTESSIRSTDDMQRTNDLPSITTTTTTHNPIKQIKDLELSNSDTILSKFTSTVRNDYSTTVLPTLLSTEQTEENSLILQTNTDRNNITDYEDDQFSVVQETTTTNFDMIGTEIITQIPETDKKLEDNLAEESLIFDKLLEIGNSTEQSTDEPDQTTEDFIGGMSSTKPQKDDSNEDPSSQLPPTSTIEPFDDSPEIDYTRNMESLDHTVRQSNNHSQKVQLHEDAEPFIDSIESNNRFVYHHLPTSTTTTQTQPPPTTTKSVASDIQEQLRIINMIVEEKKRKAQHGKIRFPDNDDSPKNTETADQRAGLRADLIRFPEVTSPSVTASPSSFSFPTNRFDPDKYLFHRRYFQPIPTTSAPTTTTTTEKPQKPFWWLPQGWEVDQKGERPLLIRFWSRMPNESSSDDSSANPNNNDFQFRSAAAAVSPSSSSLSLSDPTIPTELLSTTTSGYRENSRSPTDNLYREISAQEVYKVLGAARQWRHNSKR